MPQEVSLQEKELIRKIVILLLPRYNYSIDGFFAYSQFINPLIYCMSQLLTHSPYVTDSRNIQVGQL